MCSAQDEHENAVAEGSRFVEKVLRLAERRRISQKELATMVGIQPGRFSEGKKGTWFPQFDVAIRLARRLDVSLDYLVNDAVDEPPDEARNEEQRTILRTVTALGIDTDEAIRRLHRPSPPTLIETTGGSVVRDVTPGQPMPRRGNNHGA